VYRWIRVVFKQCAKHQSFRARCWWLEAKSFNRVDGDESDEVFHASQETKPGPTTVRRAIHFLKSNELGTQNLPITVATVSVYLKQW